MTARSPWRVLVAVAVATLVAGGCVGSGKVARVSDLGPLPAGVEVVADSSTGCREGESGFDYRWVVLTGTTDLSGTGPLLRTLRANGYYHSVGLADDLPWVTVAYQNRSIPLRAEIGRLADYLAEPVAYQGPDPASLPEEVRRRPEDALLVALRPTDFGCATPL